MIRGRHNDDCPDIDWHPPLAWKGCDGCQPCPRPHCLVQWHGERGECMTHAETVCPACLGKVREHLGEIVRLSGLPLLEQVLSDGSTDTEASDLIGPSADPVQWRQRGNYGHMYQTGVTHVIGELHPLWVLGTWDLIVTEHLGHKRTQRAGIRSSAAYLDLNLRWLAADLEFDFPSMAEEVEDCREYLERVLHDGEQRETGAPCLSCGVRLRLVRTKDEDRWTCPRCKRESSDSQYRFAVKNEVIERSPILTLDDMAIRVSVPAKTLRTWASIVRVQADGEHVEELAPLIAPSTRMNDRDYYAVTEVELVIAMGGDTRKREWRARRADRPAC